jgi:excinuclease ABC subunit C
MKREELKKFKLPDEPGVYFFRKGRKILYIGKAASLQDRVRSYFASDLADGRGTHIVGMVAEADGLSWQKADSVLEALILEANLIKRHEPTYNTDQKDNKSWNYLVLTKEEYPRVLVVRGRELFQGWDKAKVANLFGPFPHGGQLQEAVKMVRRIFPFRDSRCTPCGDPKNRSCKPCFNRQIGVCPGVCTGEATKAEYANTVRNIKELFSGKFKGLKMRLAKEMRAAAKTEDFEKAEGLRRQVSALEHIRDVSLIKQERKIAPGGIVRSSNSRIEAYDVAHTGGSETVAVMTVVEDGEPHKAAYRKFRIRTAENNDVGALREALVRRLNHPEWPLPRLFVVDGGKGQVRGAERVLKDAGIAIPVVGVVKDEFHRPKGYLGDQRVIQANEKEILIANSEAHRFGINWHRKRLRFRQ